MSNRAARGHDQTADRAQHSGEGDGGNNSEQQFIKALRQQRRSHVAAGRIYRKRSAGHGTQTQIERQDIEEANRSDAKNGAFARADLIFHGVIADQNMRQRRRAQKQRQHQRKEIDFRQGAITA